MLKQGDKVRIHTGRFAGHNGTIVMVVPVCDMGAPADKRDYEIGYVHLTIDGGFYDGRELRLPYAWVMALDEVKPDAWQAMATAPKDRLILMWEPIDMDLDEPDGDEPHGFMFVGCYAEVMERPCWINNLDRQEQAPTLWRELPPKPKA